MTESSADDPVDDYREEEALPHMPWHSAHDIAAALAGLPFRFGWLWFASRCPGAVWRGLPAIVCGVVMLVLVAESFRVDRHKIADLYLQAAATAVEHETPETAALWLQQASNVLPNDRVQYRLAQFHLRQGNTARGVSIIQSLAPLDRDGYPEAHMWLADRIAASEKELSPERLTELRHHLINGTRSLAHGARAHGTLGVLLMNSEEAEAAVPHLTEAVREDPVWLPFLAEAQASTGDLASARMSLRQAFSRFEKLSEADPANIGLRLDWARTAELLGEIEPAIAIIDQGRKLGDDQRLRQRLVSLKLAQYDRLAANPENTSEQSLKLLHQVLQLAPESPELLNRIASLASRQPRVRAQVRTALEQTLEQQVATPMMHFVLGVIDMHDGRLDPARLHFDVARQQGLEASAVLNNIAWLALNQPDGDLEAALQLTNSALAMDPGEYEILDTRGQIHARLEHWPAAIADLETAIPHLQDSSQARAVLEACYRQALNNRVSSQPRRTDSARE